MILLNFSNKKAYASLLIYLLTIVIFSFLILILSSCSCDPEDKSQQEKSEEEKSATVVEMLTDSAKAIGIWTFPMDNAHEIVYPNGTKRFLSPNTSIFSYDGTYVTIQLWTMKGWMWKTPDDYYKTSSKWSNDTLYYLPPFGRWNNLAVFKDDHFITDEILDDSTYIFSFEKISESEVEEKDSCILKDRKPHDYSIKSTDPYVE